MCRRLPDGSYRYCPSRQPRGGSIPIRSGSGADIFSTTSSGHLVHTGHLTAQTALDGFAQIAHTGGQLDTTTARALSDLATAPISPRDLWDTWNHIAAGTSISATLTAMAQSGWLARFPELAAIQGVPQDPHWHPEGDVLTHAGLSGDHMARQCEADNIVGEERTLLVLAATLHDLGKATHTHIETDGKITSYGHDDAGVAPVHRFLASMDAPKRFHDVLEPLVKEHMCAATLVGDPSPRTVARLQRRLGPATLEQWVRVVNADHGGRGSASVDDYATRWLTLAAQNPPRQETQAATLVTGRHLIEAGLRPSPEFRNVLAAAARAEADGLITDEASAREWVRAHLATR